MNDTLSKEDYLKVFEDLKESRLPKFQNVSNYGKNIVEYVYSVLKEYYTLEDFIKVNFPESPILTIDVKEKNPDSSVISQSVDDLNQTQYCINYISSAMGERTLLETFVLFKDDNGKEFILDMSVFPLAYEHQVLYHPDTKKLVEKPLSKMYMVYIKK